MSAPISLKLNKPPNIGQDYSRVGGFTPLTTLDYPGKLAAVIFIQGCPWRCSYCHNPALQSRENQGLHDWKKILDFLQRRQGLLDAVVLSGGEPTVEPRLAETIAEIRQLGFAVGLHTAGIYPERLKALLPTLSWIGLDIKAPFQDYAQTTGIANSGAQTQKSLEYILASSIDYECRTTVHPQLLSEPQLIDLAQKLVAVGVQHYRLQRFRSEGCQQAALQENSETAALTERVGKRIAGWFKTFEVRG